MLIESKHRKVDSHDEYDEINDITLEKAVPVYSLYFCGNMGLFQEAIFCRHPCELWTYKNMQISLTAQF